jgi:hypothetical protein
MAGTTTYTFDQRRSGITRYDVAYTADAADGSIPSLAVNVVDGLLMHWEHNPGATPATSGLAVTLAQEGTGVDALCGGGVITTTSGANDFGGPTPNGSNITPVPVSGSLTFAATGNSVNSAVGVFSFYIMATL